MKKFIAIGAVGLALSFPALSFASDYMDLYTEPVVKSEIRNEIKGGNVEKDFMSFYTSPKTANTTNSLIAVDEKTDNEYIFAFGVRIPRIPRS